MPLLLDKNPKGGPLLKKGEWHFDIDPQDSRMAMKIGYCPMCTAKICVDRREIDVFFSMCEGTIKRFQGGTNLWDLLKSSFKRRREGSEARPEPAMKPLPNGSWIRVR